MNLDPEKQYWVGFNLVKGIGTKRFRLLIDYFGSLETAWHAKQTDLIQAGIPRNISRRVTKVSTQGTLEKIIDRLDHKGINVLTWKDQEYPKSLIEIDQSPPVLYVLGGFLESDQISVGIVGTRRASNYGKRSAEVTASMMARNGVTVISGLARGIDSIAHRSALKSGGRTIAVLGSGLDVIYPPENRELAEEISKNGAVISDYPPGTAPEAVNFPPRNRIISGLSKTMVIIEAGTKSGALITANFAAEQGRDVFALPGTINAPQSKGTNRLIQQGAFPLLNPEDVLESLGIEYQKRLSQKRMEPGSPLESSIISVISSNSLHLDEIKRLSNYPIEAISSALIIMELKGVVQNDGGMQYSLVNPEAYKGK